MLVVGIVVGVIITFILVAGGKRLRELTEREVQSVTKAKEAGRRESAVLAYHERDRRRAQKMLNSRNPRVQQKGATLLRRTDRLIKKELDLVHRIAGSARVHPHTGETIKGIRRE